MMDRSGVKSIILLSNFYLSCSHPADLLLFLQPTQQSHLTRRPANFTSPLPTDSTRSCTMRQQEVTLMRRNINTSFTGLPQCIKVTALSLHSNSLRGRIAPPTPVPVPSAAWRARCASRAAGTLAFSRYLWIWIGLE